MRKKLLSLSALLAAGMLIGGADVAQAQNFNRNDAKTVKYVTSPGVKTEKAVDDNCSDRPSKETVYTRSMNSDSLQLDQELLYEYDARGFVSNIKSKLYEDMFLSQDIKSDDYGNMLESYFYLSNTGYDDMDDYGKMFWSYDDVVKDLQISYSWYQAFPNGEGGYNWFPADLDSLAIVRDSQNRITSSEHYVFSLHDEGLVLEEKLTNTYGEGVGPEKIEIVYPNEDASQNIVYDNIVWGKCANQISSAYMFDLINDYDGYQLLSLTEYDGLGAKKWDYLFAYDDADRLIEKKQLVYDADGTTVKMIYLYKWLYVDENDSYVMRLDIAKDEDGNGTVDDSEFVQKTLESRKFDEKGRLIAKKHSVYDKDNGEWLDVENIQHVYTNDEKGRLAEYTVKVMKNGEWLDKEKRVYTYDDTETGIASVNRNGMDLKVSGNVVSFGRCNGRYVVCNGDGRVVMSGSASDGWVSLENLPSGFYIVSVNGCTVKVLR